jgi:hypothetical protein
VRDGDVPAQVHQEGHATAQDADQQQRASGIVATDLSPKLGDPLLKCRPIDQDFGEEFVVVLHSHLAVEDLGADQRGTSWCSRQRAS